MKIVTDYLGRKVEYSFPPRKIISFAPAITQTLFYLGLQKEVIGRSRFCIHPEAEVSRAINVGGTKDMKLERIHSLKPDLIIMEKEENTKEMVDQLAKHYPVYVFEIQKVQDAIKMISDIGRLTNRIEEANQLVEAINNSFLRLPQHFNGLRIAYVIWKKPYMVVGDNTYINSLLSEMGFINPFTKLEGRYPEVAVEDFINAELDYILLATEPYPFNENDADYFSELTNKTQATIVDGEMFWYGAQMLTAVDYFKNKFIQ